MRKTVKKVFILACMLLTSQLVVAQSLQGLGKLLGGKSETEQTSEAATPQNEEQKGTSRLGDLLNKVGNNQSNTTDTGSDALSSTIGSILGSVIGGNRELSVADLKGEWQYAAPACKFKSADFLKSAGGDVVASQISQKLAPSYEKLGFKATTFGVKFEETGKYTITYGQIPLTGQAVKAEENGYFNFEFLKLGTVALATTPTYIEIVGDKMVLLYEIDKFITLFRDVVGKLGITTLDSIFALLDSYDGVLIGFEMARQ